MKLFIQIVDKDSGKRSPAFSGTREELASRLANAPEFFDTSYVLVLVDDATDAAWDFSTAPLMLVSSFVSQYATLGAIP